jgi:protein-tyrosine-phosphatase
MIQSADAIFVFDLQNYRRLMSDYPASRRKLHFVGALNLEGPLFLEDPWGGSPENYGTICGQIARALQASGGQ